MMTRTTFGFNSYSFTICRVQRTTGWYIHNTSSFNLLCRANVFIFFTEYLHSGIIPKTENYTVWVRSLNVHTIMWYTIHVASIYMIISKLWHSTCLAEHTLFHLTDITSSFNTVLSFIVREDCKSILWLIQCRILVFYNGCIGPAFIIVWDWNNVN